MDNSTSNSDKTEQLLFNKLIIFRKLKNDKILKLIEKLFNLSSNEENNKIRIKKIQFKVIHFLTNFAEKNGYCGDLIKKYIIYKFLTNENIFTKQCDRYSGSIGKSLYRAVNYDVKIIKKIFKMYKNSNIENNIEKYPFFINYIPKKDNKLNEVLSRFIDKIESANENIDEIVDDLITYYSKNGYGIYSLGTAFKWSTKKKKLYKLDNIDKITFTDIIGYDYQKKSIIENTRKFVNGKGANNVLLMGARGTGKSSCVKATINKFRETGLKVVEINKKQLLELPNIVKIISKSSRKFVIFIDDLSFEETDYDYKEIKSVIEGGLQTLFDNIIIYATSNRRHVMKENWKDRKNIDDEIHLNDTVNEKLSLSDRFGIKITFLSPNEEEYLKIVDGIAKINNIEIDEKLHRDALQWELSQNKKSGRTAKQFIDHILRG